MSHFPSSSSMWFYEERSGICLYWAGPPAMETQCRHFSIWWPKAQHPMNTLACLPAQCHSSLQNFLLCLVALFLILFLIPTSLLGEEEEVEKLGLSLAVALGYLWLEGVGWHLPCFHSPLGCSGRGEATHLGRQERKPSHNAPCLTSGPV